MIVGQEEILAKDRPLFASVAAWKQYPKLPDCTSLEIRELAHAKGHDFATALVYDRVLSCPENQTFFEQVKRSLAPAPSKPTLIGIIPGAFYREHKGTGADGRSVADLAREMGLPVELVPVDSFGSLARNASLIAEWLARHSEQRLVLISLSKGSADLKSALGLANAQRLFKNVVAWISLSGLPQGTPLVTWLRKRPLRRFGIGLWLRLRGQRYTTVEELRCEPDGPLNIWPELPSHLRIIHVVAFPLRSNLAHPWASRAYERISPWGPNDGGGFLLSDVSQLPGIVYPVWGADHYLQPTWDITQLLRRVLTESMTY